MSRPLQNRVTPAGDIIATPERGLMMGNRGGRIHTDAKTLSGARWRSKAWIICLLSFKDRRREVMGASYTELFFLDEATALAAGHRPCFECRRADAHAFATLFPGPGRSRAPAMDERLHTERLSPPERVAMDTLPDGALFEWEDAAWLRQRGRFFRWQNSGYTDSRPVTGDAVHALTPPATRAVLAAGYQPILHPSINP
ncbi:MAG: hypothetical protein AAGI50_16495 [Pseudomonadota bacterium]